MHESTSGPRPAEPAISLAEAKHTPGSAFHSRSGFLCVTIAPEVQGGGVKDVKFANAQNTLAQLLLEQGLRLTYTTAVVDGLLKQAGLGRVLRALNVTHPTHRWDEVRSLCMQFHVSLPLAEPMSERADKRVGAEAVKRAGGKVPATAEQFHLIEGFFRNSDGTSATVLSALFPGCSGVILQNSTQALLSINAFQGVCTDAQGQAADSY